MLEELQSLPFGLEIYALLALSVFLGAYIQMTSGVAFAMLFVPLLSLIEPQRIPATPLLLGAILCIGISIDLKSWIVPKRIGIAVLGRLFGAAFAVLMLLSITNVRGLEIAIGLCFLFLVGLSFVTIRLKIRPFTLFGAGILSGITGTMVGLGSGPIALLYQHERTEIIRGNLGAFFAVGTIVSLLALWWGDLIELRDWHLAVSLVPWLLLGALLGRHTWQYMNARYLRYFLLTLTAMSALWLIVF